MRWSLALYGFGLLVPFLTTATAPLLVAVPLIAFGGGVPMSLSYALLIPMMPAGAHGAVTGLYSLSRGLGISLGPLLGGVAIEAAGGDYRWVLARVLGRDRGLAAGDVAPPRRGMTPRGVSLGSSTS
jgi:predicted MFS family arabinose efflux permease